MSVPRHRDPVHGLRFGPPLEDNSSMGLSDGFSREARRVPGRLEDLHGPWQGVVVLPAHLSWHGAREFDVANERRRLLMYSIVISQGRRSDLARFLNPWRLRDDWPQLRPLVSSKMRRVCERKLGLPAPSARFRHSQHGQP
jgi:hypothetical protein